MKLKSKDVIILKLIKETELKSNLKSNDMGSHGCDAIHCTEGRVEILKWVLCIDELDNEIKEEEKS